MIADRETHLDAVNKRGIGVRVAFQRVGDRYGHTIYGIRQDRIDAVVTSVEDADYDGWPLSPPVQELRELTEADGNRSLMLMGSAAYGHWSASVRSGQAHKLNPCIKFDVAVRLHRAPAYLGTAYETVAEGMWTDHPALTVAERDPHRLMLTASPEDVKDSLTIPDLLKTFPVENRLTRRLFLPATPLPQRYPATYRWRYIVAAGLSASHL